MISHTLSISPRGQITLPKKIRDLFNSNAVVLNLVDNQHIVMSPVSNVAGAISDYAKKTDLSFNNIRDKAWLNSRNDTNEQ